MDGLRKAVERFLKPHATLQHWLATRYTHACNIISYVPFQCGSSVLQFLANGQLSMCACLNSSTATILICFPRHPAWEYFLSARVARERPCR